MRVSIIVAMAATFIAAAAFIPTPASAGCTRWATDPWCHPHRHHFGAPVVRDHRTPPIVRDHRSDPIVRDHRSIVRDHRTTQVSRRPSAGLLLDANPGGSILDAGPALGSNGPAAAGAAAPSAQSGPVFK